VKNQLYKQAVDDESTSLPLRSESGGESRISEIFYRKSKQDLTVLRYMARHVRMMLQVPGQTESAASLPWIYYLEERRCRTHRIAIYRPQTLLQNQDLAFVGFISGRQPSADPAVIDRLNAVDQDMLSELTHVPGLLSYSSLEVRTGRWYNLVVLQDLAIISHFHRIDTHRYAAYELSPHYYEWIRLHNGSLPGGLTGGQLLLRATKYYAFPGNGQPPLVREQLLPLRSTERS
jgi:hypothetical protein